MSCCSRNFDGGFLGFTKNVSGQYCLLFSEIFSEGRVYFSQQLNGFCQEPCFLCTPIWEMVCAGISVDLSWTHLLPPLLCKLILTPYSVTMNSVANSPTCCAYSAVVTALNILGPHWRIWEECELER